MTTTSVVILCWNKWHLTHQLLFDLYKNCSLIEEVIVVDNGSTDAEVQSGLSWWANSHMLPIEIVTLPKNLGFLLGANAGLKSAQEDIVLLISNDVRVHEDIISLSKLRVSDKTLIGGRLLDWDTGWNYGRPYLEGWFLGTTNKGWKDLGYLDERFAPNDMEDVDLSVTAQSKGFELLACPTNYFTHLRAQTIGYGEARENITMKNKEKFREKWIK